MLRSSSWCVATGVVSVTLFSHGTLTAQELALQMRWEVGGLEVDEAETWVSVSDGAVIGGAVYVLDMSEPSVRRFDLDGRFVAQLGRAGAGPGEYERPNSVGLSGDSVVVWDVALRRSTVFNHTGDHVDTRSLRPAPASRYGVGRPFGVVHGYHLALTSEVVDHGLAHPVALIQWRDGQSVDTIAVVPQEPLMGLIYGQWNRVNWRGAMGPVGGVDALNDTAMVVVDGYGSSASVFHRTPTGLQFNVSYPLPGSTRRLSASEKEKLLRDLTVDLAGPWESFRSPDSIPAWSGVFAASDSVLWLRRGGTGLEFGVSERWVRWSFDGSYAELELPAGVTLLDAHDDLLLTTRTGSLDEAYVQLHTVAVSTEVRRWF